MTDSGVIEVVVGGQFGSEAKGAVAGALSQDGTHNRMAAVRVAGPNAGHSAIDPITGVKWALRQIPVMAVTARRAPLVIGAGSEIDPDVLLDEITGLEAAGIPISNRLYVDDQATIITQANHDAESRMPNGSTGKGIGAARANRLMREAEIARDWVAPGDGIITCNTTAFLRSHLASGFDVLIEGTQGYGLGLHAGWYPHCTSSDCRAIDFLAMAGLNPWDRFVHRMNVWVVLRTFPIRIAGNSGPLFAETSWEDLALATEGYIQPEYTTVTKKLRRVGAWDPDLARASIIANGGAQCKVALSFFDYWFPELAGEIDSVVLKPDHWERIEEVEREIGARVRLVGTGPGTYMWLERK